MSSMVAVAAIQSPTDYIQKIYEDALFVARDTNLMLPLVTTFTAQGMAPRVNSIYGTATINAINDYDDLTSQAFTPSTIATLTPGEFGGQFFLTDQRVESDPFGVSSDAAMELGSAMAEKMERDLLSTFGSLTGGTVGGAGTAITWGHVAAMLSRLRVQRAPMPYVCVMHPYHWHVLAKAVTVATTTNLPAPDFQNQAQRQFYVSTTYGVDFYVTSNLDIDGSDDAKAAMFSRAAIALDVRRAPRMEPQRDASRRGTELNLSAIYATGVWRPKFGIQATFDASAPNS